MIYFSSSFLNKYYLTFEQLFKVVHPASIVLVFDTNIVAYLRDFYLNPNEFLERYKSSGAPFATRYLIEQICRYNLDYNAVLGVDESSRCIETFQINEDRRFQTHNAILNVMGLRLEDIDTFIKEAQCQEPVLLKGTPPPSMVPFLKMDTFYQHPLIISYLLSLKIIDLFHDIEDDKISAKKAFLDFSKFMRNDVDCVVGIFQAYAWHLFGGDLSFKRMVFTKSNLSVNRKLHKIFNGAIDFVFPTIGEKVVRQFSGLAQIPIFVSTDKPLSILNSLMSSRLILDDNTVKNYNPKIIKIEPNSRLIWTNKDYEEFEKLYQSDSLRLQLSKPRKTLHLISQVDFYESKVKARFVLNQQNKECS